MHLPNGFYKHARSSEIVSGIFRRLGLFSARPYPFRRAKGRNMTDGGGVCLPTLACEKYIETLHLVCALRISLIAPLPSFAR